MTNRISSWLAIALVLALSACEPTAQAKMKSTAIVTPTESSGRYTMVLVEKFDDGLAYNGTRGLYVITDTETGREWIGVSGIGISELGSHTNGGKHKHTVEDER
jgi:hypothetical protein